MVWPRPLFLCPGLYRSSCFSHRQLPGDREGLELVSTRPGLGCDHRAAEVWLRPLLLLPCLFFPPFMFPALPSATSSAPSLFELQTHQAPPRHCPLGRAGRGEPVKVTEQVRGWAGTGTPIQPLSSYSEQAASEEGEVSALLWPFLGESGPGAARVLLPPSEPPFFDIWGVSDLGSSVCLLCHEALVPMAGLFILG